MAKRADAMSEPCRYLHEVLSKLPRFEAGYDLALIPENGVYFLFENGEEGHGKKRIVRVGTHRSQNGLAKRIKEHLLTPNKDRSIFRKHIGRCLLSRECDPFLKQWEIDLTTRLAREKFGDQIDLEKLREVEESVSAYMNEKFSFVVLEFNERPERLAAERSFIATIARCSGCGPSKDWLGLHHPNPAIKESGLWNVQGLDGTPLEARELEMMFGSKRSA